MSEQTTFTANAPTDYYYIFYREIKSDSPDLTEERFVGEQANDVESLLDDIFTDSSGQHTLDELDTTRYFKRWIEGSLDALGRLDPGDDITEATENDLEGIAENFSEDMETRARAAGKYVIIILGEGRLITCHSYTGKRALTTEMEIIEELLSADNIDKYAEFRRNNGDITVNHFDKYDTKSFAKWLGIPVDEIVYDIKGEVKIYSEIADGIETTFKFTRDDMVEKIINTDEYNIRGTLLETPNSERNYRINQIRWGHSTYDNAEEFKQEALTHHYKLTYYEEQFEKLKRGDFDLITETVVDREGKLSIRSDGEERIPIRKSHEDFNIVLVNEYIDLEAGWRESLASKALEAGERVPIHHPGNDTVEEPVQIGALRIYNALGVSDDTIDDLHDLVRTARDLGTSNMGALVKHVTFDVLKREANAPVCHFFGELADEYLRSHKDVISEGTRVTLREGGPATVELKSPEWFYEDKDYKLVEKLTDELKNGAGMVVIGIDEDGGKVKGIQKNRFPHERLDGLQKKVGREADAKQVHVVPVPINGGDITITATQTG